MTTTSTELGPPQGGRAIQLTDAVQADIVRVVKAGSYLKVAAQYVGVGESTLRSWLTRGRKAAGALNRHDPDHLYCPQCDNDRTVEVRDLDEQQQRLDEQYEAEMEAWRHREPTIVAPGEPTPEPPMQSHGVLNPCPNCHSDDQPAPFELEENDARCLAFLEAVTRAETDAEVFAATAWRSKFTEDWRAARDYLVRRHPERWAATTRVQISSEEAEARISTAVDTALTALGIDFEGAADGERTETDDLLDGLDVDLDGEDDGERPD